MGKPTRSSGRRRERSTPHLGDVTRRSKAHREEERCHGDEHERARDGDHASARDQYRDDESAVDEPLEDDHVGHELQAFVGLERGVPGVLQRVEHRADADQVHGDARAARVVAELDHRRGDEQRRDGQDQLDQQGVAHQRTEQRGLADRFSRNYDVHPEGCDHEQLPGEGERKGDVSETLRPQLPGHDDEHRERRELADDLSHGPNARVACHTACGIGLLRLDDLGHGHEQAIDGALRRCEPAGKSGD